ncbi:DUF2147 domain-containing protein [Bdellovibrio sp. qaytius]|nr:DUF2147 domain-containing protein [Bdellovibrio sp. qaytius]
MKQNLYAFLALSLLISFSAFGAESAAVSATATPVGFWKTIDDSTHEPRAIVEIKEVDGKLFGSIIKTFPKEGDKTECVECSGDKKNKPIIGLEIIWDLKKDGDEWNGGQILDPKNGKTYKAKISLQDNGEKLKVRGFIGFSLLGRTQTWLKSSAP